MTSVGTYLHFPGNAEEALAFYAVVFNTNVARILRYGEFNDGNDMSGQSMPEHVKDKIMNSQMLIMDNYLLQGSDHLAEFGDDFQKGNNVAIVLMTDSHAETNRLFNLLVDGGKARFEPGDAGFGYFADLSDKFGTNWMFFNAPE